MKPDTSDVLVRPIHSLRVCTLQTLSRKLLHGSQENHDASGDARPRLDGLW